MVDRFLYSTIVPEDAQTKAQGKGQKNVSSSGALQSDVAAVESVSPKPGRQLLTGWARGDLAELPAAEIEELFQSSGIETVPYFAAGDRTNADGYYSLEDVNVRKLDAREDRFQVFDGRMSRAGTLGSHWRALRTNPTPEDNPFGNGSSAEVGLSVRAEKVRWYDAVGGSGAIEPATVQRTVDGEHDQIDIYDATEPAFDRPVLVFTLEYEHEWPTDVRIWDDHGRSKEKLYPQNSPHVGDAQVGSATVGGETALQWQHVFVSNHDFVGRRVIENERVRLVCAEGDQLYAHRYDAEDEQYSLVSLGASPWRLWDVDIYHIGQCRVDAQFEFEDTSASTLTTHNLNMSLKRGYDDPLWLVPTNSSAPPQGLIDRLSPIAHDSEQDPAAQMDIISRGDIDQ